GRQEPGVASAPRYHAAAQPCKSPRRTPTPASHELRGSIFVPRATTRRHLSRPPVRTRATAAPARRNQTQPRARRAPPVARPLLAPVERDRRSRSQPGEARLPTPSPVRDGTPGAEGFVR